MAPLPSRDPVELYIPVAFVVDSSLALGTEWGRTFGEYVSPLLTRLYELYTGQGQGIVRPVTLNHLNLSLDVP